MCDVLANIQSSFAMRVDDELVARPCLPVGLLRVLRTAVVVALAGHCVRCAYAMGSAWVVLLGCARSAAVSWLAHAAQRYSRLSCCIHYSPVSLDEMSMREG